LLDGLAIENDELESWRRTEIARYRDQAIDTLTRLMTRLSETGETEAAIEAGTRVLRLEPLHEPAVRRLMRLYGESGRRGPAIQIYRTLADALKAELDAQPDAETRAVFAEVTRGSEELTQAPAASAAPAAADAKHPPHTPAMAGAIEAPGEPPLLAPQLASAISVPRQIVPRQAKTGRLNWILAGGLAAVIAIFLFYEFAPTRTAQDGQTGLAAVRAVSSTQAGAISIAVLPFENLSGDATQEFFSDGMTEEITSALAKIADLRVVGRTSAFQFKGEKKDLRAIGQALLATHLLEGSVRKAGPRVRVAVQLVKTDDGKQIWSESYDRELTDVFAIQEDIATAISGALRMPLGLKAGEHLVSNRSIDPESYQQYLRAKSLVRGRGQTGLLNSATLLEDIVVRNPNFAPAWALLALDYHLQPNSNPTRTTGSLAEFRNVVNALRPMAEAAAQRAVELDPNLADGYLVLAELQGVQGNFPKAVVLGEKALGLDPNNPQGLHDQALGLAVSGHVKESLAVRQKLIELEPSVPNFVIRMALVLWLDGQNDAAIAILKDLPPDRTDALAYIYASMGRYRDAIDIIEKLPPGFYPPDVRENAVRLLRTAPAKSAAPQSLPPLGALSFVYLYVGAPERVLELYERGQDGGYVAGAGNPESVWHPAYASVRKTERFKIYLRRAGFVDYWRAKGWPEFCHPTTADDFICA
jgi:TolB-like protein/Flp pilus assembly protein TadD